MHYRTRFLFTLARTFLLSPFLTTLVLRALRPTLPVYLSATLLTIISVPAVLVTFTLWTSFQDTRAARRLGALPIPVVRGSWPGNLDVLKRLLRGWRNGYINETLRELFQEYQSPTINIRILWVDQIWTMDPNHIKHILVSSFQHFDKGAPQRERMSGFLGTGIFAADGEMWKMHRAMIRPFLAISRTSDIALFARHTEDAIVHLERLAAARSDGEALSPTNALDLQELTQRYTLDVALDSFFGIGNAGTMKDELTKSGAQSGPERPEVDGMDKCHGNEEVIATSTTEIKAFARAMEQAADITILRARQGVLWPLIEFRTDKTVALAATMRRWIDAVIHRVQARERTREKDATSSEAETFVEHLVRSTVDEEVIRDQLINMVLGARDTTAALLTFAIYLLALHPEVYTKLREEVMTLCPPGEELPEGERVKDFVYLRAVLNETLRVFPSVPINTRYSTTESVFPPAAHPSTSADQVPYYTTPLYMPPNTSVSLITLLMHRRVDLWGVDAEEFRPARWLGGSTRTGGVDHGTSEVGAKRPEWFVPFSAGPRLCPGQNFAYSEATYFLIRIAQCGFAFNLAPACQPPATRPPATWKEASLSEDATEMNTSIFAKDKGRQRKEECWPGAAFTLYSKGGLWMYVSKLKEWN